MRDLSGMVEHRRFMAERDKDNIIQQYSEPYFQGLIAAYTDIVNFAIDHDAEKHKKIPHFDISHPQGYFDITSLSFKRDADLGIISAEMLLFFRYEEGMSVGFTRYNNDAEWERSGINNIYWNDNFDISDSALNMVMKYQKSIVLAIEAAFQYWLAHDENENQEERIQLELVRNVESANKSLKPTSKGRGVKRVLNYQAKLPRPLEAA